MSNRSKPLALAARRRKVGGSARRFIFWLLVVASLAAAGLGPLVSAQLRRDNGKVGGQLFVNKKQQPAQPTEQLSDNVRQQIAALVREKQTRTRAQRKMDSQLIYAVKMARGEQITAGVSTLNVDIPTGDDGRAVIDITARVSRLLLSKLRGAGATVLSSFPQHNSVRVSVPLQAVESIAGFPEVIYVQPMQEAIVWRQDAAPTDFDAERLSRTRPGFEERERNISEQLINALDDFQTNAYSVGVAGVRKSEADATMTALLARNNYGFDGTGVKIGVLSDGVRNLATVQASGDLGPVTVVPGQSGLAAGQCSPTGSCDEGTAMLELVHDLAPGAQLYFATAFGGIANFANNIRTLRDTYDCDIIVDDVFYFAESPFQDGQAPTVVSATNGGIVTQAVNDVTADGALYFSSAGNSGNKNDNTSGVWEGDYVDGGPAAAPIGAANGNYHQFPLDGATPARPYNLLTTAGGPVILNWSDALGASGNDYDLYALNAAGTTVTAASTGTQDGNDDPFEGINTPVAGSRIVVVKFSGVGRFLRVTTNRGRLGVNTPGQTSGHNSAANAFGTAATPASGAFPGPHDAGDVLETFSSDGPRKLFFQPDGTEFTPGDVSAAGGINRQKPDITATDGASVTGAGGFGIQFFGTSAAAPHAAAITALLKSANPALTPAQIRTALTSTAIDIEAPGVDRDAGAGIVMANALLASQMLTTPAANLTLGSTVTADNVGGNANGYIEPGERATLAVQLNNTGTANATGVTATLSTATPNVFITPPASRSYPDIPMTNGMSNSATPFEFVLQEGATYGANIDFVLTVTYTGGPTRIFTIQIPTGRLANISTTLDTTAPTTPPEATASATGTQTGRLNFTFPISTCGTTKTNPGPTSTLARRYDSYTFTNTSASTICVSVLLTHSANALIHAVAYVPAFVPATPAVNYAADGGGSTTSGAGTAQLFSFNVAPASTFTVVVSESNQNGGLGVAYNLRVSGLPADAVPANAAPVNTVPGMQNVPEDGSLTFSSGNGNAISVADPDAGNNPLEVDLSVTNGTFSLSGTTGLSFTTGDGTADANMVFTGSQTDINNALNGSVYTPAPNYNGPAMLSITTDDQNFTGTGGAQSDTDTVDINVVAAPDISIRDAKQAEPATGSANMVFTVALSAPAAGPVSVDFTTADETPGPGKAVAGSDYTTTTGTVNFMTGEVIKTISVPVLADGTPGEPDETFLVNLSNPVGDTIVDGTATGTITAANPPGTFIISEMRAFGPGGSNDPNDDFIELYNNTDSPVTVAASDASAGWGVYATSNCSATPTLLGTIPNGTEIPARGHYLLTGSAYSLANYGGTGAAAGDQTMSADLPNGANVAVFSTSEVVNISSINKLDAVGFGNNVVGICDLLREGTPTLGAFMNTASLGQYSLLRDPCGKGGNPNIFGTCPTGGSPQDTNSSTTDFILIDPNGTDAGMGQHIGAAGPENINSPLRRDSTFGIAFFDASVPAASPPNRVRDFTSDPVNNSTFGTLSIRRRFVNNTGQNVTRLRFRIVDISTFGGLNPGTADLRARTVLASALVMVNDPATCAATGVPPTAPCMAPLQGTTLEEPPTQINGGGFNSTLAAGVITPGTPLLPGQSINLQFLLGIQQTGSFKFYFIIEAIVAPTMVAPVEQEEPSAKRLPAPKGATVKQPMLPTKNK